MESKLIGQLLLDRAALSQDQLDQALGLQGLETGESRLRLGEILLREQWIDELQLVGALAEQSGLPAWDLESNPPDAELKSMLPSSLAQDCRVLVQGRENGSLRCVAATPLSKQDLTRLEFLLDHPVRLAIGSESEIVEYLRKFYGLSVESMIADLNRVGEGTGDDQEVQMHDLREMAQEPTLINLVNLIITNAIDDRASDIHIEPFESDLKIRYRVDGILHDVAPPPKQFQSAIVSRIKIMAGMDIAERFVPQDGQIRVNFQGDRVDIRVSTVPTVYGETVVLRLLRKDAGLINLTRLGMKNDLRVEYEKSLHLPHGINLVCGPTGSGKSTTLYASLMCIFSPRKKIITIEDPVEYKIHGINQIPVRPKRGLTFATGLRAIVRQDPDVIMVGEIRDKETADISIRSALTGHLVFSTLHTNDAPGSVTRLLDMGVEPYLVASSLQAALGQRLVRRLCQECKRRVEPEQILLQQFGVTTLPNQLWDENPDGCDECHGRGYLGRIGIFELLLMNDQLHEQILAESSSVAIKRTARSRMRNMREDGWDKILAGETTPTEVLQATQFEALDAV